MHSSMADYLGFLVKILATIVRTGPRIAAEVVDWEPVMCPVCGSQLQITYLYDKFALGENVKGLTEPHYRKVITRIWELVPRRSKHPS